MSRTMSKNKIRTLATPTVFTLLGLLFPVLSGLSAQMRVVDKIVAQVGNEIALLSELETQYQYETRRGPVSDERALKCKVLESLLVERLLLTHAELDSVIVSDVQVEAQLDARMSRILQMMNGDEERLQSFYGESAAQLKNRVRQDMKDQLMIQTKQQDVIASVDITPNEVIEFFNQIPVDSLPLFNSEVEIAEILVSPAMNEEEKKKAKDKLEGIKQRINDGEEFAELARIYSDDPGSARQGGQLGMLSRGMLVPEYEAAVFALEAGQMSPIVESVYGYHLIELIERRGNNFNSRHILIKPEITPADLELAQAKLSEARELITSDSITFGQAVKEYSDEQAASFNNGGRITNPQTGTTFFEANEIDPDIFFAIDRMEVGDVSEPIEFREPSGDRYYRIVQLQGRTDPHRASLSKDYNKICQIARANKKNEALADWIESKIDETFIEVDPRFIGCPNLESWGVKASRP